jgi:tRNA/tmRNA/rRNA uracil-C5-methylase (TrmA/RlmC/RlmD family)
MTVTRPSGARHPAPTPTAASGSAAAAVPETIVGARLDLTIGAVAHGGHCVARADDGRVVFVRHSLPGEHVIALVTDDHGGYLRADAVEILSASPDRVTPPCRFAGPDRCGGCDFQHATAEAQRALKTTVVIEQLTRLGRMDQAEIDALGVRVEPLPAGWRSQGSEMLGWRSRLRYTVDATGRAGLLKHRSHEVVPVDVCVIAAPAIQDLPVTRSAWPDDDDVEVVASSLGDSTVMASRNGHTRRVSGPARVRETAGGRDWRLDPSAFWQVHPAAPDTLTGTVMEMLAPRPGERAWDLYGGAGIFAAALAARVGERGSVTLVESDARAVVSASDSLADLRNVTIVQTTVERARLHGKPDVIVLDPPRSGAGARVVRMVTEAAPRAIAYVACDPASFARDVATFRAAGWRLDALRSFDAFPMTHHIESVGLFVPAG